MFHKEKFYRHKNTLDMDMYVLQNLGMIKNEIKLKVRYWNRHYKIFQPDFNLEYVIVKVEDVNNWREINEYS